MENTPDIVPTDTTNNHVKPTTEELQGNIDTVLKKLEEVTPETTEPETEVETKTEEPKVEEPKKEESVETKTEDTKPEDTEDVNYKKKYVNSARESLILHSQNKKFTEAIENADNLPAPTDEELKSEFPEWDLMSDTEKRLATKSFIQDRRFNFLKEVTQESKTIDEWTKKVDGFVDDPKTLNQYQDLEGKTEDFKLFAMKKSRMNTDFEDLVKAFLFDESKKVKPVKKGPMFDTGTGGANEKPKNGTQKMSMQEAKTLREQNYNEYVKRLRSGQIDMGEGI